MVPENISKEHIIKAIKEIDEMGVVKSRQSSTYDLLYNDRRYPPKLVLSIANKYANGKELDHNQFTGGLGTPAFKKIESEGFEIEEKLNMENNLKNYDSGAFKKAMEISKEIVENGLSKVAPKKGTKEHNIYTTIIKSKISDYKESYNKSPNLVLKDILQSISDRNELGEDFEVLNFKYWGRVVQSYAWSCISLKSPKGTSNPQSLSPQLYILIDHELIRAGICYGDYLEEDDDIITKPKENYQLMNNLWQILNSNKSLDYYSVNNEGLFALKQDFKLIKDSQDLVQNWNAGSHISSHYKYNQINENTVSEVVETINSLVPTFLEICSYSGKTIQKNPTYWLYSPGRNAKHWDDFYDKGIMGIGWDSVGDLKEIKDRDKIKDKLGDEQDGPNNSLCLYEFSKVMNIGDIVVAKDGRTNLIGYGYVDSDYYFDKSASEYKHRRKVRWQKKGIWNRDGDKLLVMKTLTNISKYESYVDELNRILDIGGKVKSMEKYSAKDALKDLFISDDKYNQIINMLNNKLNIILQGPPGTGKSFSAKKIAYSLIGEKDDSRVQMIQFHQSYSYEDFIQGFRPDNDGNFKIKNGVFYNFCKEALNNSSKRYVFIIDEINRGNLSKIFGELMLLIEKDKRKEDFSVPLTYSNAGDDKFHIPNNIYIIGLMNTADRSLAFVDYALRRRFAFIDLEPEFNSQKFKDFLKSYKISSKLIKKIILKMNQLNNELSEDEDLGQGYQIGHSYFTPNDKKIKYNDNWFDFVVKYEIAPLIKEYWFDDKEKVEAAIESLSL